MAQSRFTVGTAHSLVVPSGQTMQGVCVDPAGGFWVATSTNIYRFNSSWTQTLTRNVVSDLPTTKTQLNGICYDGTKLYVGASNFNTATPKAGWIVEYDPVTLVAGTVHSIGAQWTEGCAIRSGEFWVFYHDQAVVDRYDSSWTFVKSYSLPGYISSATIDLFQGGFWDSNDYLYLNRHNNVVPTTYWVYKYDSVGDTFSLIEDRDSPFSGSDKWVGQGMSPDFANSKVYWAQRVGTTSGGNVVESSIVSPSSVSLGNGWTCLDYAETAIVAAGPTCYLNTTGADLIVVASMNAANATTFSDSLGNTWTSAISMATTTNRRLYVSWCKPTSTGIGHSFTAGGAANSMVMAAAFSGSTASPFDQASVANTSTTPGSLTPANNNALCLSFLSSRTAATYTIGSGFTIQYQLPFLTSNYDGGAWAYLTQSTPAAVNPAWSTAETAGMVVFNGAGAGGATVSVPAGSLTLTGLTPTVTATANNSVAVPAGSLALTGFAPTVAVGGNQSAAVPAGALALTGFAPTVNAGANNSIAVPAGSLSLTGQVPTVTASNNQSVAVPAGSLSLTGLAPTVTATQANNIQVPLGTLALTGYAPTVLGVTVVPTGTGGGVREGRGYFSFQRAKRREEYEEQVEAALESLPAPKAAAVKAVLAEDHTDVLAAIEREVVLTRKQRAQVREVAQLVTRLAEQEREQQAREQAEHEQAEIQAEAQRQHQMAVAAEQQRVFRRRRHAALLLLLH